MTKQEKIEVKHASIAAALAAAQMQMGKAAKSSQNLHFRSKYADLASVMNACLPALNSNGIAVVQPTLDDDGERYVETVLIHADTGHELRCRVPLIVQKNDMQGYGSAVTYARRYGLMSMAGIAPEDDDGNAAAQAAPAENEAPRGLSQKVINAAIATLTDAQDLIALRDIWGALPGAVQHVPQVLKAKNERKDALEKALSEPAPADDLSGDEIPY